MARSSLFSQILRLLGVMTGLLGGVMPLMWLCLPLQLLQYVGFKRRQLPGDSMFKLFGRTFLALAGVHVRVEGGEHVKPERPYVIIYNHASFLDALVMYGFLGENPISVFKKELLYQLPFFSIAGALYGNLPIDRSSREQAVAQLHRGARAARVYNRSIALAPEGTRSKDGELLPFKKGAFHLALELRCPVLMLVFDQACTLYPPSALFTAPGRITMRVLPPLEPREGETADELLARCHSTMSDALAQMRTDPACLAWHRKPVPTVAAHAPAVAVLALFAALMYYRSLWLPRLVSLLLRR